MRAWDGPAVKKRRREQRSREDYRLTVEELDALVPRTIGSATSRAGLRRRVDALYAMVRQVPREERR